MLRLAILQALTAQIESVPEYDLTGKVYRGRAVFGDDQPLPAISVLESTRFDNFDEAGDEKAVRSVDWQLVVQGWTEDDKMHPTDNLYPLLAAVLRRLIRVNQVSGKTGDPMFPVEYRLGNLITEFRIGAPIVRPVDGSNRGFFYLPLTVVFTDDLTAT